MTDFDYDVRQRKQLAQQARYRKNGSKSRKCTLRQDHLTNAQLKKMNGEVITFNMNMPIYSWKDFKALSRASATEYITGLDSKYDPSMNDLAKMFGVTYNTVRNYLREIECPLPKGIMPPDKKDGWERFLKSAVTDPEPKSVKEEQPKPEPVKEEQPRPEVGTEKAPVAKSAMHMREFALEFDGDIDLQGVINSLNFVFGGERQRGLLRISFAASERRCEM